MDFKSIDIVSRVDNNLTTNIRSCSYHNIFDKGDFILETAKQGETSCILLIQVPFAFNTEDDIEKYINEIVFHTAFEWYTEKGFKVVANFDNNKFQLVLDWSETATMAPKHSKLLAKAQEASRASSFETSGRANKLLAQILLDLVQTAARGACGNTILTLEDVNADEAEILRRKLINKGFSALRVDTYKRSIKNGEIVNMSTFDISIKGGR